MGIREHVITQEKQHSCPSGGAWESEQDQERDLQTHRAVCPGPDMG